MLQVQRLVSSQGRNKTNRGTAMLDRRERNAVFTNESIKQLHSVVFVQVQHRVYSTPLSSAFYWVTSRQGAKKKR